MKRVNRIAPKHVNLRSLFPPEPDPIRIGDTVVGASKLAKVIAIDRGIATMARIEGEHIETFTCSVKGLMHLRDAPVKSLWLATTNLDALEVVREEEEAQAAEKERKRKSKKAKPSKKLKRKSAA